MKITKESIKKMIILEFENLNREVSTQDQSLAQAGSVASGYSQSEITIIIDTLTRVNLELDNDTTLSPTEIEDLVHKVKHNIIPAVNTLSTTVNRKYKEAYPESGE